MSEARVLRCVKSMWYIELMVAFACSYSDFNCHPHRLKHITDIIKCMRVWRCVACIRQTARAKNHPLLPHPILNPASHPPRTYTQRDRTHPAWRRNRWVANRRCARRRPSTARTMAVRRTVRTVQPALTAMAAVRWAWRRKWACWTAARWSWVRSSVRAFSCRRPASWCTPAAWTWRWSCGWRPACFRW